MCFSVSKSIMYVCICMFKRQMLYKIQYKTYSIRHPLCTIVYTQKRNKNEPIHLCKILRKVYCFIFLSALEIMQCTKVVKKIMYVCMCLYTPGIRALLNNNR